jgi:hypothetical protein
MQTALSFKNTDVIADPFRTEQHTGTRNVLLSLHDKYVSSLFTLYAFDLWC